MRADPIVQASVLSALVEGPQFVCVHDAASPLANFVSPAFLAFAGLPMDALHSPDLIAERVHPGDREGVEAAWSRAESGERVEYEFRLRAADGAYRWMGAVVRAVPRESGDAPRFVVTAQDIEERKRADRRLQLLVRAGELFHQSLEIKQTLGNVARLAVEEFADRCTFDLLAAPEEPHVTVVAHRDPASAGTEERLTSKIVVPATDGAETFGELSFGLCSDERYFTDDDVELAKELGRRAGAAVANARRYTRERHIAVTLQRAFIPEEFPLRPGMAFDALYRPGKGDAEIGGDWYDVFETRRGQIVVAIGDVTGNGVEAAQTMVQLRQAIRVASARTADPSGILRLANDALFVDRHERFASAWVGVIPPAATTLQYASAGHPPPFLRCPDGTVEQLPQLGQLLGVAWECEFQNFERALEPGMLLALYTDGLTEIARDVHTTEREIAQVLADAEILSDPHPAERLERAIVRTELRDDLAILTLRFS